MCNFRMNGVNFTVAHGAAPAMATASLETIACHYRLWQHIHMCRKAAPQREVWRQLRVITDWGRKVESPCQVQNCVANPEASRLAPFTAPMGSVWVTSPMEHFQQCQFVTRAWTQQIPLSMTSSGNIGCSSFHVTQGLFTRKPGTQQTHSRR